MYKDFSVGWKHCEIHLNEGKSSISCPAFPPCKARRQHHKTMSHFIDKFMLIPFNYAETRNVLEFLKRNFFKFFRANTENLHITGNNSTLLCSTMKLGRKLKLHEYGCKNNAKIAGLETMHHDEYNKFCILQKTCLLLPDNLLENVGPHSRFDVH